MSPSFSRSDFEKNYPHVSHTFIADDSELDPTLASLSAAAQKKIALGKSEKKREPKIQVEYLNKILQAVCPQFKVRLLFVFQNVDLHAIIRKISKLVPKSYIAG